MTTYTIVNDQDEVLEYKPKGAVDFARQLYRVAALWLTNTQGEVLLAQRSLANKNGAGQWGPAVAGTVEAGENYEANIYKEAAEEIGLTDVEFQLAVKTQHSGQRNYFCQWFTATIEPRSAASFQLQTDEVNTVTWLSPKALVADVRTNPQKYLPGFEQTVTTFISEKTAWKIRR